MQCKITRQTYYLIVNSENIKRDRKYKNKVLYYIVIAYKEKLNVNGV